MRGTSMIGLGTALPPLYVEQRDAYRFYEAKGCLPSAQQALYSRLLLDGPIRGRYFGMREPDDVLNADPDAAMERFTAFGRRLAAEASRKALNDAGVAPEEIGGVVVNTCTGYLCPGLTSYLAEDLGLNDDALAASRHVFREYGNMSSPTVLFALRRLMETGGSRGRGLLLAFGAGFTAFAALAVGQDAS